MPGPAPPCPPGPDRAGGTTSSQRNHAAAWFVCEDVVPHHRPGRAPRRARAAPAQVGGTGGTAGAGGTIAIGDVSSRCDCTTTRFVRRRR